MVRPARFGFNSETAATNHLQQRGSDDAADAAAAISEFDGLVSTLREAGVTVGVLQDVPDPPRPDAVFPNNWVSLHPDGRTVLYPMANPSRRIERRAAELLEVAGGLGFRESARIDLTGWEQSGRFLEGTGSLVLDHVQRIAYVARSPRSDEAVAQAWCEHFGYELIAFDAATGTGASIYHTNVLLWIGESVIGFGGAWIDPTDRERVRARLLASGRTLVEFDDAQLGAFAGNMLEVRSATHGRALVMSATAAASLVPAQRATLHEGTGIVVVGRVPVIEERGGGSVRCMLAEVP